MPRMAIALKELTADEEATIGAREESGELSRHKAAAHNQSLMVAAIQTGVHNCLCRWEAELPGLIEDHGAEDIGQFCLAAPAMVAAPSRYAVAVAERAWPLRRQITVFADTGPQGALRRPQTAPPHDRRQYVAGRATGHCRHHRALRRPGHKSSGA